MPGKNQNRRQLAEFLRSRRQRVSPQLAGLPVGSRRQAQGLRREEVAVLAGISPTWYTYLEQGREINPSPEVIDSLARVLHLTEDERRYVHLLAFGHVINPKPLNTELTEYELASQLVSAFGQGPNPIFACDHYCDLIAWNAAAAEWYDDWGRLPPEQRNIIRWLVTVPRARESLVDYEEEARDIVARWRGEAARWPQDNRFRRLVAELSQASPQFADWWQDHEVREHQQRIRWLRNPRGRVRGMRIVFVRPPEVSSAAVIFHIPVGGKAPARPN